MQRPFFYRSSERFAARRRPESRPAARGGFLLRVADDRIARLGRRRVEQACWMPEAGRAVARFAVGIRRDVLVPLVEVAECGHAREAQTRAHLTVADVIGAQVAVR